MKAANLNHLWGKLLLSELARLGVGQIFLSPGSRSTPLAIAAAESDKIKTTIHFDERGAAFAALGYAKACGRPAVLICTSGTALVNYYPAIVEASMSLTPLIVLSADRPVELRDCGAPQTINQVEIFGDYLRHFVDLPAPAEDFAVDKLLGIVDDLYFCATGSPGGPVQLNCQVREPLAPLGELQEWHDYLAPVEKWLASAEPLRRSRPEAANEQPDLKDIARALSTAKRGVIIAGPLPPSQDHDAIVKLAEALKWPLIADISSGLRADNMSSCLISHADLYLRDEQVAAKLKPDLVLHFGAVPSSKTVLNFAATAGAHYIQISEHQSPQDPLHVATQRLPAVPNLVAQVLQQGVAAADSTWLALWQNAEASTAKALDANLDQDKPTEPNVARWLCANAPAGGALFLSNSMPIRDVDAFAGSRPAPLRVGSNRGANGIDGVVASGVGFACGCDALTTILLGDLALLHDLNSLALVRESQLPVIVVVLNNNGGGIFHFLPVVEVEPHFEHYFGTPHGYNFAKAAELFSLRYSRPESMAAFANVYTEMASKQEFGIIEITSDRRENAEEHRRLWHMVRAELAKLWGV